MPLTIGSSGKVSEGTYSKPSDYAASQRSKEREREARYEQQRSNFFSGIFGGGGSGGGGSSGGSRDLSRTRPKLRPSIYDPQTETYTPDLPRPTIKAPTDADFKDLNYDNVPYFSGESIRPKNMVFKDGMYVPLPEGQKLGLIENFIRIRSEIPKGIATDLRLGLGSLRGIEGFTKALEGMGYGTFRDDDGNPSAEAKQAYTNFRQTSRNTRDAASASDSDDDFYGNYDPCPEGYRTDPVTGMCVPVMGVSYETAPSAPAQYQGNFVGDPFPTIASGGGMTSPVVPSMDYTQPMDFTSPAISPPVPQGIAGIPLTPIMV